MLNDVNSTSGESCEELQSESLSHPVKTRVFVPPPFTLIQSDQDDNGKVPRMQLTTVLRKQAEHTLKVNKLQDSRISYWRQKEAQAERKSLVH